MTTDRDDKGSFEDGPRLLSALDGDDGPAHPIDPQLAARIAQQIVARALLSNVEGDNAADAGPAIAIDSARTQQLASRVTRRFRQRHLLWQVAAACVLAMAVGSGAWAAVRVWLSPMFVTAEQHEDATIATRRPSRSKPARPVDVTPTPAPSIAVPPAQPATTTANEPRPNRAATDSNESAEQLLERANAARARKQWAQAERLYARVVQLDIEGNARMTDNAYAATVAAAALQLEHMHDARAALARYRTALSARPAGSLSEEARYGVASAQRALQDDDAEQQALEQFLAHHPRSLFAPHAQQRLHQLTERR